MSWRVAVERHGAEGGAVVVIDGFAPDPQAFVDDAAFLAFRPMGEHYPGLRAVVAPAMLRALLADLAPIAAEVFGVTNLAVVDAFHSIVTTPPAALAPIQRMPHFDGVEPERLALLHYLSRDERSGTAFFRHRATGFETVTADRLPAYTASLRDGIAREGVPQAAYIAGDTALFERIALHEGRWNRAILYNSNALHCAHLPADLTLAADPEQGRYTVNTFLTGRIA